VDLKGPHFMRPLHAPTSRAHFTRPLHARPLHAPTWRRAVGLGWPLLHLELHHLLLQASHRLPCCIPLLCGAWMGPQRAIDAERQGRMRREGVRPGGVRLLPGHWRWRSAHKPPTIDALNWTSKRKASVC